MSAEILSTAAQLDKKSNLKGLESEMTLKVAQGHCLYSIYRP